MTLKIKVNTTEIDDFFDDIADAAIDAARPAAKAGADVIYERVKLNAPRSEKAHYFYGSATKKLPPGQKKAAAYGPYQPGNLAASIRRFFDEEASARGRAVYGITWSTANAPYAYMVEYGTVRAPAFPFVRPAVAVFPQARQAMVSRFYEVLRERGVIG